MPAEDPDAVVGAQHAAPLAGSAGLTIDLERAIADYGTRKLSLSSQGSPLQCFV